MKNIDENFKTIIINIISNIIFQVIIVVASGSGIIYAINKMLKSLKNSKVTISIFELIMLIILCVIALFTIDKIIRNIKNKNDKKMTDISNIKDYYFSKYEKNITIYNNGTGIVIHKFTVVVKDVKKLLKIHRNMNIEDGVKTAKFPSLHDMMATNKADRFKKYGFWYKSDNNIITEAKEYYWSKKSPGEDKKIKNNPQEIRWIFKIDRNKIKKNKQYEICYVISVPGLAALENGYLKPELLNDPSDEFSYSIIGIDHKIQHLIYTISFENGVNLDVTPKCQCNISVQDELKTLDILGEEDYDLLYTKYIFNIENPKFGSNIIVKWKYSVL